MIIQDVRFQSQTRVGNQARTPKLKHQTDVATFINW